jgi:hypothetical protein
VFFAVNDNSKAEIFEKETDINGAVGGNAA